MKSPETPGGIGGEVTRRVPPRCAAAGASVAAHTVPPRIASAAGLLPTSTCMVTRRPRRSSRITFPVALQQNWEVSRQYAMFATPVGYLIDGHGVLASDAAAGVDAT